MFLGLSCSLTHIHTPRKVRVCSVARDSLQATQTAIRQAPLSMEFSRQDKDTGVGCRFLLQGTFPNQGSNQRFLCLLYCRRILSQLSYWGSPIHTLKQYLNPRLGQYEITHNMDFYSIFKRAAEQFESPP